LISYTSFIQYLSKIHGQMLKKSVVHRKNM
jgi:hypothetical protein